MVFKKRILLRKNIFSFIVLLRLRGIVSLPFIYMMFIPVLLLDISAFLYQQAVFRIYKIPFVKRKKYIIYDRNYLEYLSTLQKINCIYCSYINGLLAYFMEISARTEQYWCPIKYEERLEFAHNWYKHFADYGDLEAFKKVMENYENNRR